jgi:hypothetical protein
MKASERLMAALNDDHCDWIPVVPKIWLDFASRLTEVSPQTIFENSAFALHTVIDASGGVNTDAVWMVFIPKMKIRFKDSQLSKNLNCNPFFRRSGEQLEWITY